MIDKKIYDKYVKEVSTPIMAISWELSVYLETLCGEISPKNILDLGSGFSSYVFRSVCSDVTSVDDNPVWLERTKKFLCSQKLNVDNMFVWKDFVANGPYDLIFHDIGDLNLRFEVLGKVLELGKLFIFDDMHKKVYPPLAEAFIKDRGFKWKFLEDTVDEYGRYSWLVWSGNPTTASFLDSGDDRSD